MVYQEDKKDKEKTLKVKVIVKELKPKKEFVVLVVEDLNKAKSKK